ncbi:hypothetical protein HGP14_14735 [Rhizobium sp. P32RR-XVIII]|uniref:hypothetical protein n=1 Tax=Rhizobium sp. P32RR-XVIII TaxID=2726738 RepID=UPI00145693F6|nr:hypothetical protein [Rhizobium sp. P32RR-XVIII]NLS04612.1 hypothetical protein [Rhizobium sp. P32RR-XVIII]
MDLTTIETVLGLASSAVGVTSKAASTADAIKKLFSSEKAAPDNGEAMKLVNALAGELTTANVMNVQLSEALRRLSDELRKEDEFAKEKARYALIATERKDMVYRLREDAANGQPIHDACPVCMHEKKIMYIRGEGDTRHCQANNHHIFRYSRTPPPRVYGHYGRGDF